MTRKEAHDEIRAAAYNSMGGSYGKHIVDKVFDDFEAEKKHLVETIEGLTKLYSDCLDDY